MCRLLSTRTVRKLLFLSLLAAARPAFTAGDEPDFNKEKRLFNNYQRYNLKPTSPEAWRGATGGKSMTYQIQQADTLWEMSEVLFGDPEFWPKIWSLNAEKIENPHEIFPGQVLKFAPGTMSTPPSLAVGKAGEKEEEGVDSPMVAAAGAAAKESKQNGESEEVVAKNNKKAPPPLDPKDQELLKLANIPPEPPAKPVGQFPESIPPWAYGKRTTALQFEVTKIPQNFAPANEVLSAYLAEQKPASVGSVVEAEMGQETVAEFQYIFVKLEPGTTQKKLLVLEEQDEIKDPVTQQTAHVIQVQGEIEVINVVNTDESIYRAVVKKIINPIRIGAFVTADPLPKFNAQLSPVGAGQARVIGGAHSTDRKLFEPNSLVFLSGSGLTEGQSYPVYKQQVIRQEKTRSFENPVKIATIKVVKSAGPFATGVVLHEDEEIHVGDVTDPHMRTEKK
jgi:hypothetical protein